MVSLYCDEDVNPKIAILLSHVGHSVRTTTDERRTGAWDPDQLAFATDQGSILITHNRRDFRTLHDAWMQWLPRWRERQPHSGILILDHGPLPVVIAEAIRAFLVTAPLSIAGQTHDWFARDGGTWKQWRS
ncbi:MAG: DUF5615 family PIN-like protein [Thermomicrobiales bacterium]